MTPMAGFFGLGPTELIIILVIVLLLFGGARLAGLGKSTGRAIREFKEETKSLKDDKDKSDDVVDAEVVDNQQPQTPPAVGGSQPTQSAPQQSVAQPSETRRDA